MKRTVSILLALAMVLSLAPLSGVAFAEERMTITWMSDNTPLTDGTWGEKTFEELFNVDVVLVRAENAEEKNVVLASGNIPDFINVGNIGDVANYVDQGVLSEIPIEMIKENMPGYYALATSYDPLFFDYTIIDGKNMALPRLSCTGGVPLGAAIRADWLKAAGIDKVPATIDELEAAFIAFRENDPDGNGQKDTYALSAGGGSASPLWRLYFPSIFSVYGINPFFWHETAEGKLEYGFVSKECKEALTRLAKWYQMELIDPEFVTDEFRTSGQDTMLKVATGRIGYYDNTSFDDYQWDNDGNFNAKWVANSPEWQKFFADNAGNHAELYKYVNTADFDDSFINPYYINPNPVANTDGVVGGYINDGNVGTHFGIGVNTNDAQKAKILQILEACAMDPDVNLNHYGPEGTEWIWNEDKTQRVFNPEWPNHPEYHHQGLINGKGWCLWPMYFCNPELLTLVGGERQIQRYDRELPLFESFKTISNSLKTSLPAEVENPELTNQFVRSFIVKAIRGEVDIETGFDAMVADWLAQGGQEITDQANEWWASIKG